MDFLSSWGYVGVLVAAAIPWFELFAIPPAIALGMQPVMVGVVAGVGNGVVTVATVLGWERLADWRERRSGRPFGSGSRRSERAHRVFERYGVPGLALQGPMLTGIYLAAIIALGLGAPRRQVLAWSLASVVFWSIVLVVLTVVGVELITGRGQPEAR